MRDGSDWRQVLKRLRVNEVKLPTFLRVLSGLQSPTPNPKAAHLDDARSPRRTLRHGLAQSHAGR
jgi:hypothetical protein